MMVGAVTTLDGKLFHISTVLCVNEYFRMFSLECDLYIYTVCIDGLLLLIHPCS
jgi:hypothetical protein